MLAWETEKARQTEAVESMKRAHADELARFRIEVERANQTHFDEIARLQRSSDQTIKQLEHCVAEQRRRGDEAEREAAVTATRLASAEGHAAELALAVAKAQEACSRESSTAVDRLAAVASEKLELEARSVELQACLEAAESKAPTSAKPHI